MKWCHKNLMDKAWASLFILCTKPIVSYIILYSHNIINCLFHCNYGWYIDVTFCYYSHVCHYTCSCMHNCCYSCLARSYISDLWLHTMSCVVYVCTCSWMGCLRCIKVNAFQLMSCNHFVGLDSLLSAAYPMITYTRPTAGNLPIKNSVAKQQPTKWCAWL